MLNAYFVSTFYYAIYCTVQHHRILLYKYGAIEINKHLHFTFTHHRYNPYPHCTIYPAYQSV